MDPAAVATTVQEDATTKRMTPEERRRRNTACQAARRLAASKAEKPSERKARLRREADRKTQLRNEVRANESIDERKCRLERAAQAERESRKKHPRAKETSKQMQDRLLKENMLARVHNTAEDCLDFISDRRSGANTTEYNVIENGRILWYQDGGRVLYLYLGNQGEDVGLAKSVALIRDTRNTTHKRFRMTFTVRKVAIEQAPSTWVRPPEGKNITIHHTGGHNNLRGDFLGQPNFYAKYCNIYYFKD